MNRSDVSEEDHNSHNNSINTTRGSGAEDEDLDTNTKYVPPRNIPISEIWDKDSDDPALTKYKQQLIGSAINIIIGI